MSDWYVPAIAVVRGQETAVTTPEPPERLSRPLVWTGAEELPILYANQFLVQFERHEFILTLGQVAPPIILGNDEDKLEQFRALTHVAVKSVGRVAMGRQRAVELADLLRRMVEQYDARERAREGRSEDGEDGD